MKFNKRIAIIVASTVLILALIGTGTYLLTSKDKITSQPTDTFGYQALKFNGQYVSQDIFVEERNKFFQKWSRNAEMLQKTDEERNDMLLDEIIKRVLIEYYLNEKAQITITASEIDEYVNKYIDIRYSNMGGVQAYMDGMGFKTKEEMRKNVEFYLKRVKYFSKVASEYGVALSDSDLETQYQKQKLENTQIVGKRLHISNASRSQQDSLKLATDLYNRIRNGEDFATLAKQYSEDEESKSTGGLMDRITGGIYSKEFDNAVFNASPGQLIPPVPNMNGYDVVYVEKLISFYHPKNELKDMLLMQNFGESDKFKNWFEKAKATVSIEITDPEFKAYRLYKDKKYNEAGKCYEEVFDRHNVTLYLDKAIDCYKSAGSWDKVLEIATLGMKKFPEQVPYYTSAAEANYKKQNISEAKKLMKKAEKLSNDSIVFKQQIIKTYSEIGLTDDSKRVEKEISDSSK